MKIIFLFLLRNLGVLLHLPFFLYVPPLLSTVSHSSNYFTNNAKKGTNCSDQPSRASIQCQNSFYFVSGCCSSHLLHTSSWSKHDTSRPLLNSLNHQKVFSYIKLKSASLQSHPLNLVVPAGTSEKLIYFFVYMSPLQVLAGICHVCSKPSYPAPDGETRALSCW